MQKLEGALGRARIAIAETEIGIDNADQIELGKMMALGHQLRADDNVKAARRHVVEFLAQALHGLHQIAREHQNALVGKQLGRLLFQPLDARPYRREAFGGVAVRAFVRRCGRRTAMVAHEPLA
jgi:hypothetical protein